VIEKGNVPTYPVQGVVYFRFNSTNPLQQQHNKPREGVSRDNPLRMAKISATFSPHTLPTRSFQPPSFAEQPKMALFRLPGNSKKTNDIYLNSVIF
jgi:hypothetical protein